MTEELSTINGTITTDEAIVNKMMDHYHEEFEAGRSPISFFGEGGQIRNIFESVSNEAISLRRELDLMLRMAFVRFATGEFLDILGEFEGVSRKPAQPSNGMLLFYFEEEEVKEEDTFIPEFTRAQNEKGIEYETTEDCIIKAGESSVEVPGISIFGGVENDTPAHTINIITEDEIDADLQVDNPEAFTGATESEDDEHYRSRILEHKQGGSSVGKLSWYKSEAEQIEGVHDVLIINNPNEKFTVSLIINGTVKPTSSSVIDSVMAFFNKDDNRIGGTDVFVTLVETVPVSFQSACTINNNYDEEEVKETIQTDIKCLLEGGTSSNGTEHPGLRIGESLSLNQVYNVLLNVEGLTSFYLTLPSQDVQVSPDKVLVLGEIDLLA